VRLLRLLIREQVTTRRILRVDGPAFTCVIYGYCNSASSPNLALASTSRKGQQTMTVMAGLSARVTRVREGLSPSEWTRVGAMVAFIVALHVRAS